MLQLRAASRSRCSLNSPILKEALSLDCWQLRQLDPQANLPLGGDLVRVHVMLRIGRLFVAQDQGRAMVG
jgi:hypothetical protein